MTDSPGTRVNRSCARHTWRRRRDGMYHWRMVAIGQPPNAVDWSKVCWSCGAEKLVTQLKGN